ncbi:CapA family protein [Paenibacillus sp. Marseille-Q4541]|uniref:CapA family protein n=1 Tax=Paenibacillus sp. Marseille-Q4541 TaxID=2831522 RepID=UPI001BA4BAEE|nr:CapA family protein [Paenibacillus sp. Marseille-Q4541]
MLPSRTEKSRAAKKKKQRQRSRMWLTINMVLVVLIAGVFIAIRTGTVATFFSNTPYEASLIDESDSSKPDAETSVIPKDEAEQGTNTAEEEANEQEIAEDSKADLTNEEQEEQDVPESKPQEQQIKERESSKSEEKSNRTEPVKAVTNENKLPNSNSASQGSVTMNFAGDVQFSGKVEELLLKKGFDYPYQHLGSLFKKDDLTFINLETPVTTGGVAAENKSFVYKSSPKALKSLAAAGVDVVNLANNHILDQGVKGLTDTLTHLNDNNLDYVGAGKDRKEAYAPAYYEKNGIKIALLGFTRVIPEANWRAEAGKPGVADAYNSAEAVKAIAQANKKADIVIVMAHWGQERHTTPDENQKKLGYEFIDAGADLVIGGHPHVLQGLESYKGKWIAYSTGNFIFSRSATAETWKTAIFQATCQKDGNCSMKLLPYHAELAQPVPMNKKDGASLLREIQKRSFGAKIGEDGTVIPLK